MYTYIYMYTYMYMYICISIQMYHMYIYICIWQFPFVSLPNFDAVWRLRWSSYVAPLGAPCEAVSGAPYCPCLCSCMLWSNTFWSFIWSSIDIVQDDPTNVNVFRYHQKSYTSHDITPYPQIPNDTHWYHPKSPDITQYRKYQPKSAGIGRYHSTPSDISQ